MFWIWFVNKPLPPSVKDRNDRHKLKSKPLWKDRKTKYWQNQRADTQTNPMFFIFYPPHDLLRFIEFFKTIADSHCTHCQRPTSQTWNLSFVKECNFADTNNKAMIHEQSEQFKCTVYGLKNIKFYLKKQIQKFWRQKKLYTFACDMHKYAYRI